MPRSPKGLITNNSVTPEEMVQLGMRSEQIGFPDVCQEIKNLITHWRRVAGLYREANPATDGTLDCTAAAAALLKVLKVIEHYLAAAERNAASGYLYLVYYALLLATYVHQFTIIDNEKSIVARTESIEGARRGGSSRSAGKRSRNRRMAQKFLNHQGGRLRDTALMVKIGDEEKLKRSASINAVKSGLRDLNNCPALPR
jgi:hypothetical protein